MVVLKEIFKEQPDIIYYDERYQAKEEEKALSKDEENVIKERLRSLGYL